MTRLGPFVLLAVLTIIAPALAQTDMRRGGGPASGLRPGPGGAQWGPGGGGYGPGGGHGQGCWNCGYMGMMGGYESGNPIPTMPPPPASFSRTTSA